MPEFKLHEGWSKDAKDAKDEAAAGGSGDGGAEEYKTRGNDAFKNQNWDEAIKNYNKAITLDPKQASYYSNRAACWSSKGNHESALSDANKCLERDESFIKGYSRKGKALFDLGRLDEAEAAYQDGLAKDPSNAGCLSGVADIKRAREARKSSSRSSASASWWPPGGGAGGLAGMGRKVMETMKNGRMGGRMQMYAVVMVGYLLYQNFVPKGASKTKESSTTHESAEDEAYGGAGTEDISPRVVRPKRSFSQLDGSWVSYLEVGRGDSLVLMLHSTSLSAEAELSSAMGQVLEKVVPGSASGRRGIQVLAPDRPCHGFSPCPRVIGKAQGTAWLEALLGERQKFKQLTIVASGRSAARQALALAHERSKPSLLLLLNPGAATPARGAALSGAAEARAWLERQPSAATAAALADAARWAASVATDEGGDDEQRLVATGLPEGSRVSLLYARGEKEEMDFREELEGTGLLAKSRKLDIAGALAGSTELAEALADEVLWLLSASEDVEQ